MSEEFTGRTVLVTGSTQNLGHTIATHFARSGARVILHGPALAESEEAARRLRASVAGADAHATHFDLGDMAAVDAAFADLERRGLRPDILVNNAAHLGLGEHSGFLDQSVEFFREVIDVNLIGAFRCAQRVAGQLVKSGLGGAIVNITSLAGERPIRGRSAYSTSKAALEGLTRAMALELAPHGIRVNAISAGYVWTPRWDALPAGNAERRRLNTPAGEPTQQDEIARLALFLASGQAPTLTGGRIVIDGGLGAQQVPADVAV